ncbi:MAG TPA: carboxypeptidase regulatory-like domain-containing protein [Pyrinomonadaceae bacterium]|jgi:hypothetical protein
MAICLTGLAVVCLVHSAFAQGRGQVRGTLTFRDRPLSGVLVVLFAAGTGGDKTCLTDAAGNFEIHDLPPAHYFLSVANTAYVMREGLGETFREVEVRGGEVAPINIQLVEGAVIAGCAQSHSGQPLVAHEVSYEKVDSSIIGFSPASFRRPQTTDDQGCFRIYGLPEGKYLVALRKPSGVASAAFPARATYYPGVKSKSAAEIISLQRGQEYRLDRIKEPDDSGRASLRGHILDGDNGEALPNFQFELVRYAESLSDTILLTSDESGFFRSDNLSNGQYRLQPNLRAKDPLCTFSPISLNINDKDPEPLVVRCEKSMASVSGEVLINNFTAARDEDCTLVLQSGEAIQPGNKSLYRITLRQGRFKIAGLSAGMYTLVVMPLRPSLQFEEAWLDSRRVQSPGAFGVVRMDLRNPQTVKIQLKEQ